MRAYLDACPIIYLVEQNPAFSPAVAAKLASVGGDLISSDLAWLEALVVPYRNNNAGLVTDFENFFQARLTEVLTFSRATFDRAARIRAAYPFKAPDALHLAVAVEGGCDVFVTNDPQLKQFTGITVETI